MDVKSVGAVLPVTLDRNAYFPSAYSSDNNFGVVKGGKKRRSNKRRSNKRRKQRSNRRR
jgi:hypothetical protein